MKTRFGLWLFILSTPSLAEPPINNSPWRDFAGNCIDLNLTDFRMHGADYKQLLQRGSAWEDSFVVEQIRIQDVVEKTCKRWAENPNGDGALSELIEKYGLVESSALQLEDSAVKELSPTLAAFSGNEERELRSYGFSFLNLPCGRAFRKMSQHVQKQIEALRGSIKRLEASCPVAADTAPKKNDSMRGRISSQGQGSGSLPVVPAKNRGSDITGTNRKPDLLP